MRQARSWTLRDLAGQSGVSQGMLSKLESRSVNPSLSVIERIASAFGMSIGQFLGEDQQEARYEAVFLPRERHRVLVNQITGYTREELSPALHGAGIQFVRSTIAPGSGEIVFPPHAPNIEELIYLLKGRLRVTVGSQEYHLKEGDSIFLKPTMRHSYTNLGPEECVCFIVIDSHMAHHSE
jgi:transcriptional regulator with XRE-family HTH domain